MTPIEEIINFGYIRFKRYLIFVFFFFLFVSLLTVVGCSRYKDLPPGTVKQVASSGFQGVDLAVLQRTNPFINETTLKPFARGEVIHERDNALGLTKGKQKEDDNQFTFLTPFGHEFFHNISDMLKPGSTVNKKFYVPRQYLIGHEDQISVFLGSPLNKKYILSVDENGNIEIPGFGSAFVGGMTFEEMTRHIFSKIQTKSKIHLDISMNPQKTITVFVRGEVRRPIPYAIGAFSTVTEALGLIGGLKESGSVRSIEVRRKGITVSRFDLYELLIRGIKFRDITLMDGDEIYVPVKGPMIGIDGSVKRPAIYELKERLDLESIIALAGGVIPGTEGLRIQVKRIIAGERKTIYDISDEQINLKGAEQPVLYDGDIVLVSQVAKTSEVKDHDASEASIDEGRLNSQAGETNQRDIEMPGFKKTVLLTGEFKNPGRYSIQDGEKLSSVIERAGGYTNNAYLRGAYFTRESIRQIQQEKLSEIVERIQRELLPDGASSSTINKSEESFKNLQEDKQLKARFVEYIKALKPTGRLKINLAHLRLLKVSPYDIAMEDLDHLHIPQKNNMVNTIGSVITEGPHVFEEKLGYREYISAAGGYSRGADEKDIFVVKVDGSSIKMHRGFIEWSDRNSRWELTPFMPDARIIEAGDVIVVPEKIGNVPWLKHLKNINSTVMNIAVITGIVIKVW